MRKLLSPAVAVATAVLLALVGPAPASAEGPHLAAKHVSWVFTDLPDTATSNSGAATHTGFKGARLGMGNSTASPVTNPTVTVDSGYSPSLFDWGGPVAAFPASKSIPGLAPGTGWDSALLSTIETQFAAGFDSTRTVDHTTIPVGGGQQTVTVTVTPTDARYEAPDLFGQFIIGVDSYLPGVTVASWSGPSNLDQGEELLTPTPPPSGVFQWQLVGNRPHRGKQYSFSLVLNVPNPYSAPIEFRPEVAIEGVLEARLSDVVGSQASFADPALDGGSPGRGGSVFSVAESNQTWVRFYDQSAGIAYVGTLVIPNGPTEVPIAVKPFAAPPAPINLNSNGTTLVAVMSNGTFDATTVDPATVRFGRTGTEAAPVRSAVEDINHDGRLDLVLHFSTQNCGFTTSSTVATLTGKTTSGQSIKGADAIRIVG